MSSFRVSAPGNRLFVYQLSQPETTIGRDPQNDLVLDDPRVSRRHAVVQQTPAGVFIRDQQSGNGTFVNQQRVTETKLAEGDTIKLGDSTLTFNAEEEQPKPDNLRQVLQKTPDELITASTFSSLTTSREIPSIIYRQELEKKERILALF